MSKFVTIYTCITNKLFVCIVFEVTVGGDNICTVTAFSQDSRDTRAFSERSKL